MTHKEHKKEPMGTDFKASTPMNKKASLGKAHGPKHHEMTQQHDFKVILMREHHGKDHL